MCLSVAVIVGRVFLLPSFSGLARESSSWANTQDWIPAFGENDGGEGDGHSHLLARMTWVCSFAVIVVCVFLLPSFSGLARESSAWANTQDWIPAFGENDGGEGDGHSYLPARTTVWIPAFGENDGGEAMVIPTFPREQRSGFPPLARMMGRHHPTGFVRSAERIRQGCETMSWCIRGRCQCLAHVCRLCKTVFCNSPGPFIPPCNSVCRLCKTVFCNSPCNDLEQPQCVCRLCKTAFCNSSVSCVNSVDSRNHSGILAKRPFRRPVIAGSIICLFDCYTSFLEAKTIVS